MLALFKHQWKETFRSTAFQKNIVVNILIGFFIIYFLLAFLGLGFMMEKIILKIYPDSDPVHIFNGFLFLGFMADLAARFFLQELPTMTIQPYLHLPIKRNKLVNNMLIRSAFSFFNFSPLLLFVPFSLIAIAPRYGGIAAVFYVFSMFLIMLINNYVVVYFKRKMAQHMGWMIGFAGSLIALAALDYFDIINLSVPSAAFFGFILANPWMPAVLLILLGAVYYLNQQYLLANAYMEEISIRKEEQADGFTNISWLDQFGEIGKLITLEIKLILRHKRPKTLLKMTPLLLLYGLIFYSMGDYTHNYYMIMFIGLFVSGVFFMNYGQYLYSWESEHFDGILSQNIDTKKYIQSKFFLMVPIVAVCYILTIPYIYFGVHIFIVHTIMFIWNAGVSSFILLYFSTNNSKRLELSKGGAFNWQGVSAQQFIMVIPLLVLPQLIFFPFNYYGEKEIGLAVIGIIGLVNLFLYDFWIDKVVERFNQQKYRMAAGFRKKEG